MLKISNVTTIKKLSDVFGVSPCDLMKWDEEPEQTDPINLIKEKYGSDTYELIELFSKLNEKGKSKILEELSDMVQLQKYTEPVKKGCSKNGIMYQIWKHKENIIIVDFRKDG